MVTSLRNPGQLNRGRLRLRVVIHERTDDEVEVPRGTDPDTRQARAQAACRKPASRRSQSSSWFQLARRRLTSLNLLTPNDRNLDPR